MYDEETVDRLDDVAGRLDHVVAAVRNVEAAVKDVNNHPIRDGLTYGVIGFVVFWFLGSLLGDVRHSKWRYTLQYGVDTRQVLIDNEPHDCDFLASPLGAKYCHYERVVSTVRWATSTTQQPIVSYDEGKTWTTFTPDSNVRVPQYPTLEKVFVSWQKKQD